MKTSQRDNELTKDLAKQLVPAFVAMLVLSLSFVKIVSWIPQWAWFLVCVLTLFWAGTRIFKR
jgi:hypothetical protein